MGIARHIEKKLDYSYPFNIQNSLTMSKKRKHTA